MWLNKWLGRRGQRQAATHLEVDIKTLETLRQAGFTTSESERLCLLRKRYQQQANEQACADLRRLQFARWLVMTGKLTDRL
jgi:hypothetical protein